MTWRNWLARNLFPFAYDEGWHDGWHEALGELPESPEPEGQKPT